MVGILEHSGSKTLGSKFAPDARRFGLGGYPHGIVMHAADRNLAVIKLQERPTFSQIIHIMWQVTLASTLTLTLTLTLGLILTFTLTLAATSCDRWRSPYSTCMTMVWYTATSSL